MTITTGPKRNHWASPGYVFVMHDRERLVLRVLQLNGLVPLEQRRILEVGCGTGAWLRDFVKWGADPANVIGLERHEHVVALARRLVPSEVCVQCGSAEQLEYGDDSFDIVLQATMFSSIPGQDARERAAREMMRVVKPDGVILWYDLRVNNPRNPDVRGFGRRDIEALFPGRRVTVHRTTLAMPLARAVAPLSWTAGHLISRLPFLNSHYLAAVRRNRDPGDGDGEGPGSGRLRAPA